MLYLMKKKNFQKPTQFPGASKRNFLFILIQFQQIIEQHFKIQTITTQKSITAWC
jgi:hypothetical protein